MPLNSSCFVIRVALYCFIGLTLWLPTMVSAQAYCALRDPSKKIYEFYPDATSFRSLVRTVDENVRQNVAARLPFTIHFNELGRHTLYLPVKGAKPQGLVHARSEAGEWGLTEIIWSLTPDLVIQDFSFQRCRSRKRTAVETAQFKKQLVGKTFGELRELLDQSGNNLSPNKVEIQEDARTLAASVIRSALKTIAVTQITWKKELDVIQPLFRVNQAFPETASVQTVDQPYTEDVIQAFRSQFSTSSGKGSSNINRDGVQVFRSFDEQGKELGFTIKTPWKSMDMEIEIWWYVRPDGVIKSVNAPLGWPDKKTEKAFETVVGLATDKIGECNSAAEIAGAEVLLLVRSIAVKQ